MGSLLSSFSKNHLKIIKSFVSIVLFDLYNPVRSVLFFPVLRHEESETLSRK